MKTKIVPATKGKVHTPCDILLVVLSWNLFKKFFQNPNDPFFILSHLLLLFILFTITVFRLYFTIAILFSHKSRIFKKTVQVPKSFSWSTLKRKLSEEILKCKRDNKKRILRKGNFEYRKITNLILNYKNKKKWIASNLDRD